MILNFISLLILLAPPIVLELRINLAIAYPTFVLGLNLNDNQTEFIVFSSPYHNIKYDLSAITLQIGNVTITASKNVRNLRAYFDSNMTMGMHVSKICSSAHFQLWQLRKIRPYLSVNACKCAVRSLVY